MSFCIVVIISTNTMYYQTCLIICVVLSVVYECIAASGALEVLIQHEVAKVKADLKRELLEEIKATSTCCMTDWLDYGGHRYFVGEERKNWHDAQSDCQRRNANLVKIETAAENEWLKTVAKQDTWIGANDLKVQSQWRWVSDNTPISYSNWNRHEPSLSNEHCVHMWKHFEYRWNDHGCSALHGYICEANL